MLFSPHFYIIPTKHSQKIMRSGLVVDDPLISRVAVVSATVWHNMEKVDQYI